MKSRYVVGAVIALSCLYGCGGGGLTVLPFVGTYTGSMAFSAGPYTTTGSLTFDPPLPAFSGSWNDHGTSRAISGASTGSSTANVSVTTSSGSTIYTGSLRLDGSNHAAGTLVAADSSTLALDLAP